MNNEPQYFVYNSNSCFIVYMLYEFSEELTINHGWACHGDDDMYFKMIMDDGL